MKSAKNGKSRLTNQSVAVREIFQIILDFGELLPGRGTRAWANYARSIAIFVASEWAASVDCRGADKSLQQGAPDDSLSLAQRRSPKKEPLPRQPPD
jgi:hypothetical protein